MILCQSFAAGGYILVVEAKSADRRGGCFILDISDVFGTREARRFCVRGSQAEARSQVGGCWKVDESGHGDETIDPEDATDKSSR